MIRGKYIVIEGPEGVGKTTQVEELSRRLRTAGLPVRTLREPDSQSDLTARAIRQLTQDPRYPMNTVTEVLLYNAARSQSLQVIKQGVEHGVTCIVDRNYLTTLAVQYYGRGDVPDYDVINQIIKFAVNGMEPDLTIVLDAPVQTLKERTQKRYQAERFDNLDPAFLERVRAGYLWEANKRGYPVIFAGGSQQQVSELIWKEAAREMGARAKALPATASIKATISSEPPLAHLKPAQSEPQAGEMLVKTESGYEITDKGKRYLEQAVTSVDGNVYAFYNYLSPATVAAAMARLSRRGDGMRITLLDEFAGNEGKDDKLLQRVITAYGDDSVQQLAGMHLVVEDASNLLTKKLEWGRLAAYLEQSTRYIFYDQIDKAGNYKYYTPPDLKAPIKKKYVGSMDKIFKTYSKIVRDLSRHITEHSSVDERERDGAFRAAVRAQACDAVRPVLPVATMSTVGIFASGQAIESLIMHLMIDPLKEAEGVGQQMLIEARKVIPAFLERVDIPERGGAAMGYKAHTHTNVKKLADKYLANVFADSVQDDVSLDSYWPRNELDLVADMIYEHSDLPLSKLKQQVEEWPYEQKLEVFRTYIGERFNRRHKPGRALEKAHYNWDLVCDYGIFRDLQRHRIVEDLEWQILSPRYGYEIPQLIEEAGLTEEFESCFDTSLKLYSDLVAGGYVQEAQYATLLGHRMRWKLTYNAREAFHLHELRTSPQGHPGYRKLVKQMHDKLAEVHPLLAESMIFVNKGEDPELTRLAAERYTQAKLAKLDADRPTQPAK